MRCRSPESTKRECRVTRRSVQLTPFHLSVPTSLLARKRAFFGFRPEKNTPDPLPDTGRALPHVRPRDRPTVASTRHSVSTHARRPPMTPPGMASRGPPPEPSLHTIARLSRQPSFSRTQLPYFSPHSLMFSYCSIRVCSVNVHTTMPSGTCLTKFMRRSRRCRRS